MSDSTTCDRNLIISNIEGNDSREGHNALTARLSAEQDSSGALEFLKSPQFSLKTNLLSDILAVPSVGGEISVSRLWSVSADWVYGWWGGARSQKFWRIYGGSLAVRRWFGDAAEKKVLSGHHFGIGASLFTYDFLWNGKGQIGGEPGAMLWRSPNWSLGLEYGYSLPIARRLNLDFSVLFGFMSGIYHDYTLSDGHYVWQATVRRRYLGPTKAEVSLVWLFGRGNVNPGKGGGR